MPAATGGPTGADYGYGASPASTTVTTDPSVWDLSSTGQKFFTSIATLYGGDPFSPGQTVSSEPMGRQRLGADVGGDITDTTGGGPLQGIDPEFVYDLVNRLGNAKDITGEPYPFGPADITRLAQELWNDPVVRRDYGFLGTGAFDSVLNSELSQSGVIGKRGKTRYSSVAEQVANMNPIEQQNYYREQATRAEEGFYRAHQGIYGLFQQYFGLGRYQVTQAQINDVAAHGNDTNSWNDYIRTLPSHVAGVNIGAYYDIRQLADKTSQAIYGHDSNDQIVKELYDQKLMNKEGVAEYYDQLPLQPGKNIAPIVYNSLYKSANEHTQAIWNQSPSPLDLHEIWTKAGSPSGIPASQATQDATGTHPQPQHPSKLSLMEREASVA